MGGGIVDHCLCWDRDANGVLRISLACSRRSPARHSFVFGPANATTIAAIESMKAASGGTESEFRASMPTDVLDWYDNEIDSSDRAGIKGLFADLASAQAGLYRNN